MSHLSKQDRDIYTKFFLDMDQNGDGYLDMTELTNLCTAMGFKFTPAEVHKLFIHLDEDVNHRVTLDEFIKVMGPIDPRERQLAHIRRLFIASDTNKDGVLSVDELHAVLEVVTQQCGVQISKNQVQCLLNQVDLDGDGNLNYEEFIILIAALSV